MSISQIEETELSFKGSLGLLVAITFIVFEIFLLPIFEHTRENLTTAVVRHRLAKGGEITLQKENPIARALGLSDGLARPRGMILLSKVIKVFLKVSLVVNLFVWEYQLETIVLSPVVQLLVDNRGPQGPPGYASITSPIPIEGLPQGSVRGLVPFGQIGAIASRPYNISRAPGIDLFYSSHCISVSEGETTLRRTAYFGVYMRTGSAIPDTLACLNGTDGREKAVLLSYNPNSTSTIHSNISSLRIRKEVARDEVSVLYAATVTLPSGTPLKGTFEGFVAITSGTHFIKDVIWSSYGLFLHEKRGTIMRLLIPLTTLPNLCGHQEQGKTVWEGVWTRSESNITCPSGITVSKMSSLEHKSDVQDADARIGNSTVFKVGPTLDVLRAWLAETAFYSFRGGIEYTTDLREKTDGDMFFFSSARSEKVSLKIGYPKKHVKMKKLSTIALLVVLSLFALYSIASFVIEFQSRLSTGIDSECVSRKAMLNMIREDAIDRGVFPWSSGHSVTIALSVNDTDQQCLKVVRSRRDTGSESNIGN